MSWENANMVISAVNVTELKFRDICKSVYRMYILVQNPLLRVN